MADTAATQLTAMTAAQVASDDVFVISDKSANALKAMVADELRKLIAKGTLNFDNGVRRIFEVDATKIDSGAEPNAVPFLLEIGTFDVNDTGEPRNVVASMGWNYTVGATQIDSGEAGIAIAMERYYTSGGAFDPVAEFQLRCFDTAGTQRRMFNAKIPHQTADGANVESASIGFRNNLFTLSGWFDGDIETLNLDLDESANSGAGHAQVDFRAGTTIITTAHNGSAFLQQRNAADSAFENLPYLDSSDRLVISQNFVGGGHAGGDGALRIAPDSGTTVNSMYVDVTATTRHDWHFRNLSTSGGDMRVRVQVGGTSAGDPFHMYTVVGGQSWVAGIDNSDDDNYVIALSTSPSGSSSTKYIRCHADDDIVVTKPLRPGFEGAAGDTIEVSDLPAASSANDGCIVYLTNGDGGNPCMAVSSGGAWKRITLGATVSAS